VKPGRQIGLICAQPSVEIAKGTADQNGGSRATSTAKDDHAARLAFQSVSESIAY